MVLLTGLTWSTKPGVWREIVDAITSRASPSLGIRHALWRQMTAGSLTSCVDRDSSATSSSDVTSRALCRSPTERERVRGLDGLDGLDRRCDASPDASRLSMLTVAAVAAVAAVDDDSLVCGGSSDAKSMPLAVSCA